MSHSQTFSSTGVLDRTRQQGTERAPTATIPVPGDLGIAVPEGDEWVEVGVDRSFRTPGLIVLATIAIFEGYRWLGVIPTGHTGLSALASSHSGTVSLAVLLALTGHALTHQRRLRRRWRFGAAVTCAGVIVAAASAILVAAGGRVPPHILGVAYLLLAAGALSAATMSGRARRSGAPHSVDQTTRWEVQLSTPPGPGVPPTTTPSARDRTNARG